VLSVKDAQELLNLQASLLQPSPPRRPPPTPVTCTTSPPSTQAEVAKVTEAQIADSQKKFLAWSTALSKNAPAGTENAVALVQVGRGRRQQRLRKRAQGRQAGCRSGRSPTSRP
jgi:ribosomal protein L22